MTTAKSYAYTHTKNIQTLQVSKSQLGHSMSDYIPTTEEVREFFADSPYVWRTGLDAPLEAGDAFDLWLAEHDRELQAEAWDEGWCSGDEMPMTANPYREVSK